jgi:hypothetical protein
LKTHSVSQVVIRSEEDDYVNSGMQPGWAGLQIQDPFGGVMLPRERRLVVVQSEI